MIAVSSTGYERVQVLAEVASLDPGAFLAATSSYRPISSLWESGIHIQYERAIEECRRAQAIPHHGLLPQGRQSCMRSTFPHCDRRIGGGYRI